MQNQNSVGFPGCYPRERDLWRGWLKRLQNENDDLVGALCIERYLNKYVAFTEVDKPTNEQLDELLQETKDRLVEARQLEKEFTNDITVDPLYQASKTVAESEKGTITDEDFTNLKNAVLEMDARYKLEDDITDALQRAERAKSRIMKVNAVETFASMTHQGGGPLLSHGCSVIDEEADAAITDILDCLAKKTD